jgi:hypothetical protein
MSTRSRQIAAYHRNPEVQIRNAARSKAVNAAAWWVRDNHPEVWARLLAEAEVTVRLERRAR